MSIEETFIKDLFILNYNQFSDLRGDFVKTVQADSFKEKGLESTFFESFFSISKKNVIRGMHFQIPPDEHAKLVYVISGCILDVVLDIRKGSPTYGSTFSIELGASKRQGVYIGKGLAHGFLSIEDNSVVHYQTTTPYSARNESGILFDSFSFDWKVKDPVLSIRDLQFDKFENYQTPFSI